MQQLPVDTSPNQTFSATLEINGENVSLSFFLRYSEIAGYWLMDIIRAGETLISSLPLVSGQYPAGNLLRAFNYMGIGSIYLVKAVDTTEDYPGIDSLGSDWVVLWGDNE